MSPDEAKERELVQLRADNDAMRGVLRAIQEDVLWAHQDGKLPGRRVPAAVQHQLDQLRKAPSVPGGILYAGGGR